MHWKQKLASNTRSPDFLWKLVLGILGAGIVVGYAVHSEPSKSTELVKESESAPAPWDHLNELAASGSWSELWWEIPGVMKAGASHTGPLCLALFTGACWVVFVLQTLQVQSWRDGKVGLSLLAVLLGVLSIWPTIFFIYWQEYAWGLEESGSLVGGVRYFVFGVGLREEFSKLLCLLPLVPLLVVARSELTALLVSGCVGLGFALEENISYFAGSNGEEALGRYVTANPLHMTLTGLAGLALYRAVRNPRGWGPHSLATFGLVVVAHGLYDAFIAVPALNDYALFGTIIFALVIYQFFRELRELRPRGGDTISLTANFLTGVSLVSATTFVYLCTQLGWSGALDVMVPNVLTLAVMVYLFLREMPETLVTV